MNKAWATKHNVVKPQDYKNKEETFACVTPTAPAPISSRRATPT